MVTVLLGNETSGAIEPGNLSSTQVTIFSPHFDAGDDSRSLGAKPPRSHTSYVSAVPGGERDFVLRKAAFGADEQADS
jgi:hypothetical protein